MRFSSANGEYFIDGFIKIINEKLELFSNSYKLFTPEQLVHIDGLIQDYIAQEDHVRLSKIYPSIKAFKD